MSPALAHGCPDTPRQALPCQPHVRAGLYTPRGLHSEGALTHAPVEVPCSALAVDTVEERLCPYTYGSAMLRAGDKQLRVAPRPHQPQGAQSSVSSLIVTPPLGSAARGGWARGVRSGHTQAYASLPGLSNLVVTHPPERSQGMNVVWTSRGTPEHRDSGLLLALQPSPSGHVHGIATWHTSDG